MKNIRGRNGLLDSRRKTDEGHGLIIRVTNDGGVVSTATSKATTIADLELDVAHDGSLRHLTHGKDVTDTDLSLLTAIHGLTGVHTLSSEEELLIDLVVITRR